MCIVSSFSIIEICSNGFLIKFHFHLSFDCQLWSILLDSMWFQTQLSTCQLNLSKRKKLHFHVDVTMVESFLNLNKSHKCKRFNPLWFRFWMTFSSANLFKHWKLWLSYCANCTKSKRGIESWWNDTLFWPLQNHIRIDTLY